MNQCLCLLFSTYFSRVWTIHCVPLHLNELALALIHFYHSWAHGTSTCSILHCLLTWLSWNLLFQPLLYYGESWIKWWSKKPSSQWELLGISLSSSGDFYGWLILSLFTFAWLMKINFTVFKRVQATMSRRRVFSWKVGCMNVVKQNIWSKSDLLHRDRPYSKLQYAAG